MPKRRTIRGSGLRLSRRAVVLGTAVAGAVMLACARAGWLTVAQDDALRDRSVELAGTTVAPVVPAAALVALAAAAALILAGRWLRTAVLVVAAGAGGLTAWSSGRVLADPAAAATGKAGEGLVQSPQAAHVAVTAWPGIALLAGVALVGIGIVAAVFGFAEPRRPPGQRFDAAKPAGHETTGEDPDPMSTWDALSRGEDPTRPGN